MLRLVRDDETEWTEMADQEVPSESDVPRRRGRKRAEEQADAPAEGAETAEARDGALEDGDESEDAAASDQIVDKGALEAMLMSTHHPLTAGRLAESAARSRMAEDMRPSQVLFGNSRLVQSSGKRRARFMVQRSM